MKEIVHLGSLLPWFVHRQIKDSQKRVVGAWEALPHRKTDDFILGFE
jgi:hypothetical protein